MGIIISVTLDNRARLHYKTTKKKEKNGSRGGWAVEMRAAEMRVRDHLPRDCSISVSAAARSA
jgi:hypothetical protein